MAKMGRWVGLSALALAASSTQAWAQDEGGSSPHDFSATAWVVSDYAFRGVSQNDENAAFQAAFDYEHETGFYAGVWGSAVDFGSEIDADVEIDMYLGYGWAINDDWGADVQFIRYYYPGSEVDLNYNEWIGKLTYKEMITATVGYSSDVFASSQNGIYFNLGGTWELPAEFNLSAGIGYYSFDDDVLSGGDSYVDWNIGVTRAFGPFEFGLTYVDTNDNGEDLFGDVAGDRLIASIKVGI